LYDNSIFAVKNPSFLSIPLIGSSPLQI